MASAPLEYASPKTNHQPWGPILFRPSARTIILFILTTSTWLWLQQRHEPWKLTAQLHRGVDVQCFNQEGQAVAIDPERGVILIDPKTGEIKTTGISAEVLRGNVCKIVKDGTKLVTVSSRSKIAMRHDIQSGRVEATMSLPEDAALEFTVVCTPDGGKITCVVPQPHEHMRWFSFADESSQASGNSIQEPIVSMFPRFSPDGRLALQYQLDTSKAILRDVKSLETLRVLESSDTERETIDYRFHSSGLIDAVDHNKLSDRSSIFELFDPMTGRNLRRVKINPILQEDYRFSDDTNLLAAVIDTRPGHELGFWDARTGELINRSMRVAQLKDFIPGSDTVLALGEFQDTFAIYSSRAAFPVAILAKGVTIRDLKKCILAQDGNTIILRGEDFKGRHHQFFTRIGWECRESQLGLLGMPHSWVYIILFLSLMHSTVRDARRSSRFPTPLIVFPVLLASILTVLFQTLSFTLMPAWFAITPLLMICAIGLHTGGRFWRLAMIATLVLQLVLTITLLRRVHAARITGFSHQQVIDRIWTLPHLPIAIALTITGLLTLLAILARPPATFQVTRPISRQMIVPDQLSTQSLSTQSLSAPPLSVRPNPRYGVNRVQEQFPSSPPDPSIEVSIVMPCLNEADTLETCIRKAQLALTTAQIPGEIIIADNGSTDGSQDITNRLGARLVPVQWRGYGNALMGGIAAARGKFIIMGDADDSYDFAEIPRIVAKLREGFSLVQGCRLESGGGTVKPGAMPFLHRWLGNPMFSWLARWWFKAPIHDVYCGLRGFTREMYDRLDQRCTGMEFATEMIIKASLRNENIAEVPITLHPDGRKAHKPHLKTFRDGWRTLRFFLMYSPRWLFLMPGFLLIFAGLLGYAVAMPGVRIKGVLFDAHTLLFASVAILCGYQSILFAVFTKMFAVFENLMPQTPRMNKLFRIFTLERGLIAGAFMLLTGLCLMFGAVWIWWDAKFGNLDYGKTMRVVVPGATLTALGFQTILSSFFMSVLGLRRR